MQTFPLAEMGGLTDLLPALFESYIMAQIVTIIVRLTILCRARKITVCVSFFFQILPNLHIIAPFSMWMF